MKNNFDNLLINKSIQERVMKHEFTLKDLVKYSRSIWNIKYKPRSEKHRIHGATFPKELIELLIRMYCFTPNGVVLDPFMGVGTTIESAREAQRSAIGFELNPDFYQYSQKSTQIQSLDKFNVIKRNESIRLEYKVYQDDCRNMLNYIQPNSIDFMVTSPPYADFITRSMKDREKRGDIRFKNTYVKPYSDNPNDFGNLNYTDFLTEIDKLMGILYHITKPECYNIWIVKDQRLTEENIPYVSFHSDFATLGINNGFLFHDLIIWNQDEQRKLTPRGSRKIFYTNQNCSFLVVLRKPKGL